MRGLGLLVLGIAAIAAYRGAVRRVTPQLTARVIRVRLGRVTLQGNRFRVAVIISNPTSEAITVRSVVGEVYVNGKKVGTVESFETTVIQPNAKTTLYLELRILAMQMYDTILDLVNDEKINIELGMTGTINVDNRPWPIHLSYEMV